MDMDDSNDFHGFRFFPSNEFEFFVANRKLAGLWALLLVYMCGGKVLFNVHVFFSGGRQGIMCNQVTQ